MSYRSIHPRASGKGLRSNHRAQYNWFRCTSIAEALEHWDTEVESGRHADSFSTFEPTTRRRPQLESVGDAVTQQQD